MHNQNETCPRSGAQNQMAGESKGHLHPMIQWEVAYKQTEGTSRRTR